MSASSRDEASAYGPSALVTPANAVTVLRLLGAPICFGLIVAHPISWVTAAVWTALAGTDGIDGWLARRHGRTESGAFLDPLADKVLVLGGLVALVSIGRFGWLPVGLIALREVAISLYRSWWARRGVSMPASPLAKAKTLTQAVAVGLAVWPPTEGSWAADGALWLAVVLAIWSGIQYVTGERREM